MDNPTTIRRRRRRAWPSAADAVRMETIAALYIALRYGKLDGKAEQRRLRGLITNLEIIAAQ